MTMRGQLGGDGSQQVVLLNSYFCPQLALGHLGSS